MTYVTQMALACSDVDRTYEKIPEAECNRKQTAWYALCIRQRHRELCEHYLGTQSYEYFSPTRLEVRQWSDRKKSLAVPLFPGYMFCRFEAGKSASIVSAPGVISIISAGGQLLEVDAVQLDDVRKSLKTNAKVDVIAGLVRGQKVEITSGPMTGVRGVLAVMKHEVRVGLQITMMNRSVLVEVSPSQLSAI